MSRTRGSFPPRRESLPLEQGQAPPRPRRLGEPAGSRHSPPATGTPSSGDADGTAPSTVPRPALSSASTQTPGPAATCAPPSHFHTPSSTGVLRQYWNPPVARSPLSAVIDKTASDVGPRRLRDPHPSPSRGPRKTTPTSQLKRGQTHPCRARLLLLPREPDRAATRTAASRAIATPQALRSGRTGRAQDLASP